MNTYFVLVLVVASCIALCQCDIARPPNCNIICTLEINPVCGVLRISGQVIYKTFSNACQLTVYNCRNPQTKYSRVCSTPGSCQDLGRCNQCSAGCNRIYHPICGERCPEGLRTFGNDCVFWNAVCNSPNNEWKLVKYGRC